MPIASKPTADFPLFAHRNGQWAKKIQGKLKYFGHVNNPQQALASYQAYLGESSADSTPMAAKRPRKKAPAKPRKDYPLFAHTNGQWAKKIRGKIHYFGAWAEPQAALDRYLAEKDDLIAGRVPRIQSDDFTLRKLVNHFLTAKKRSVQAGEIVARTFEEYDEVCRIVMKQFGKERAVEDLRPQDFGILRATLAKKLGPTSLGNRVQRVRTLFKFGYDMELIDKPVRFGPEFKKPSRRVMRVARVKRGQRLFSAAELRKLLLEAGQPLQAMIFLGINCGFGNQDCGTIPFSAIKLKQSWVDYPRPKTGVRRRCRLWPETIASIKEAIARRPDPHDLENDDLVFITKYGQSWSKDTTDNPISYEMYKLLKRLKSHRPGLGFYALRHTFATIAGETADQVAVDFIMGHAPDVNDMAARYRETISDERLIRVAEFVRTWLFAERAK